MTHYQTTSAQGARERAQFRQDYYDALMALFSTTPGTPDNIKASAECARLYDLNPSLADDVDDALGDDLRMNGSAVNSAQGAHYQTNKAQGADD